MQAAKGISATFVLSAGHVAGMIDMVALPLWVGSLIKNYGYTPAEAGGTVTLFLISVVAASAFVSPLFDRLPHRICVAAGFATAATAFFVISRQNDGQGGLALMALLHVLAGLGTGVALSVTHGTIGRTSNPHRLFGIVNVALGVVGVFTFAALPPLIAASGGQALFLAFTAIMGTAFVVCGLAFPVTRAAEQAAVRSEARVPLSALLVVGVIICMTFNQAMVFSFLEQLGLARGFSGASVNGVLIALGFINLAPGVLAALLQNRLSPVTVAFAGPLVQVVLALILTHATEFAPYAAAGAVFVSVLIFTHTFLFGLLARLDTSGRCVSATPAMMMIGSCTGPAAGGLIVSVWGYGALGWMSCVVAACAFGLLGLLRTQLQVQPVALASSRP